MAKRWHTDGTIAGYDKAKQFQVETAHVSSVQDLSSLLTSLEHDSRACIIRGTFRGHGHARTNQVEYEEGHACRVLENFDDLPLHTVLIEVDDFEPLAADPLTEPAMACEEYVLSYLPECFLGVAFHWQLSGSAGHPKNVDKLKAHLWFWLHTPYTSAQLKAWAKAINLAADSSVFNPVQAHYTAAPLFDAGITDPVPVRSGFAPGLCGDDVELIIDADPVGRGAETTAATPPRTSRRERLDQAAESDPIAVLLSERGMVKSAGRDGAVNILCPNAEQHSNESAESACVYFPAHTGGLARGAFKCLHAHCQDLTREDFLRLLGVDERATSVLAILEKLRGWSREEILSGWATEAAALPKDAAEEVIEEVRRLTGLNLRALKATLNDARKQAAAERKRQATKLRAGGRCLIEYHPEDRTRHAQEVEAQIASAAKPGEYVVFGTLLARVAHRAIPYTHLIDNAEEVGPPVPQIEPLDEVAVLAKIEAVVAFHETRESGPQLMAVPPSIVDILLKQKSHAVPSVTGLVSHPIVLLDGSILAEDGLHAGSGLFLSGATLPGARPYTHEEAIEALTRLREVLLEGFEFATPLDADVALAALVTGIERRILEAAPGIAAVASTQSSGKTTLLRKIHVILTGRDMPVSSFPENDEAEVQKRLLAQLLRSPAMVCFDNITDGTTFRSSAVAAAMTGPMLVQRVLGVSRDAECLTNVMFAITGNNIALGPDELTRWMVCRLEPKSARPHERVFQHPDVVSHALSVRTAVLRDAVGIVAGYLCSAEHMAPATRFPRWDQLVRQPLLWAGGSDIAAVFQNNVESSQEVGALVALLTMLRTIFEEEWFFTADVAQAAGGSWDFSDGTALSDRLAQFTREETHGIVLRLVSALETLRSKNPRSAPSVARVLNAVLGRVAQGDVHSVKLERSMLDGTPRYRVVDAG